MDPPSLEPQYTIEDFLSDKRIAIAYDRSDACKEICEWLIVNGYDSQRNIQRGTLEPGRAMCYRHHGNTWIQNGSIDNLQLLGYKIINATDIVDFLPGVDFGLSDILTLMEDT